MKPQESFWNDLYLIPWANQTLFWDPHTIPQIVPTLLRDRHAISDKNSHQCSLKSTHDLTKNMGSSDTTCYACGATINEKPQSTKRNPPEKYCKDKNNKQERKPNTIFNEARQFSYVLEARDREILLLQQSITYFFSGIQFMGLYPFIYSQRVLEF